MKAADTCATAAQNLHHCMATTKKVVKPHKPSVRLFIRLRLVLRRWGKCGWYGVKGRDEAARTDGRGAHAGQGRRGGVVRCVHCIRRCRHPCGRWTSMSSADAANGPEEARKDVAWLSYRIDQMKGRQSTDARSTTCYGRSNRGRSEHPFSPIAFPLHACTSLYTM